MTGFSLWFSHYLYYYTVYLHSMISVTFFVTLAKYFLPHFFHP